MNISSKEETRLSIDSYSPGSRKDATTDSPLRKIVCTGAHSQLVAITIPSGAGIGEELHDHSDVSVFIVEGAGEVILNGQAEAIGEHDAVFIPAGTVYTLKNSGGEDLKVFVIYSPSVTIDTGAQVNRRGRLNFSAIAQSAALAGQSEVNMRQAFPGGIKWTSWKSPKVKNVLFATDFSVASEAALPYAISIAHHYGSTLYVAHVIASAIDELMAPPAIERILSPVKDAAVSKIGHLMKSRYGEDAQYEPIVAEGAVADALLTLVRAKSIDLVVLGTHGRRGSANWSWVQ